MVEGQIKRFTGNKDDGINSVSAADVSEHLQALLLCLVYLRCHPHLMSSSGVVSKKLKFKGEKQKKKKRSHRDTDDGNDEFAAMAAAEPKGESSVDLGSLN